MKYISMVTLCWCLSCGSQPARVTSVGAIVAECLAQEEVVIRDDNPEDDEAQIADIRAICTARIEAAR